MAGIVPAGILTQIKSTNYSSPLFNRYSNRDYFKELGITSFINAAAPYSSLSGSQMWPEVIEAMNYAMIKRARMKQLHDAIGKKIASLAGSEAAMVSAGAASAMTLGTAACMTGTSKELIHRLPDPEGMKNEVIIQKSHRYVYEHAIRNCGARLVEVDTANDFKRTVNKNTAMMMFYYGREDKSTIKAKEFVSLGKEYGIPTFCDGATTIPPVENIFKLVNLGFELVCFSGGKGLRGPYSAGLLLGRKNLIEAARLNGSPNDDCIGRGMKVSKEELLGILVALEKSIKFDNKADLKKKQEWVKLIAGEVSSIPGVKTEFFTPKGDGHQPHLRLIWDQSRVKITPKEAVKQLREGKPSIEVCSFFLTNGRFELSAWMLKPGEAELVASRISEVLRMSL